MQKGKGYLKDVFNSVFIELGDQAHNLSFF